MLLAVAATTSAVATRRLRDRGMRSVGEDAKALSFASV
jgi:uncharacterized membrane protein YhaH (DUF805 family)